MSLPRFSVRRPVATLMLFVGACITGVFAWIQLPIDLMPNAGPPVLTVYIGIRGGLPPSDIENLVTKVVEDAVSTVQHLRMVLSASRKDKSEVHLYFEPGTDLSFSSLEVQERLAKIKNKLPKDIEKPIVAHYSENDAPVVILALTSKKYSPEAIRDKVDSSLKPKLMQVNGVANVQIAGGRERKILVEFDLARLQAYQLSIRQVIDIIGKNNLNLLTGKRQDERNTYSIRELGQYKTIEDIKELIVLRTREGSAIRLSDLAEVRDFYLEAQSHARLNKEPTVSVYIQKENNSNTIRVAERIHKAVERAQSTALDSDIQVQTVSDASVFIKDAMQNVGQSLTVGMALTLAVIFLFLRDWRHTGLVFLLAPIAILVTFACMYWSHIYLNVMTLSALALGVGIVVDNATVVLENILDRKRHAIKHGTKESAEESTVLATEELIVPLAGGTLTMIVVFLPIIFINKQVKIMYSGLAFTMAFSMLASLLVALTLVPLLASRLPLLAHDGYLSESQKVKLDAFWAGLRSHTPAFLLRAADRLRGIFARFFAPPDTAAITQVSAWRRALQSCKGAMALSWALVGEQTARFRRRPKGTFIHWCAASVRHQRIIFLSVSAAAVASILLYMFVMEKDFLGATEQNEFIIFVELPAGTQLEVSDEVVKGVEQAVTETEGVKDFVKTAASRVEGWSSKVYVNLKPQSERTRSVQEIIDELRPKVAEIGRQYDSFVYFSEPESSKEFLIDVFGPDYSVLMKMANKIAEVIATVHGLSDTKIRAKEGQPEWQIRVDKERAASLHLTIKDIAEELHAMIRGLRPTYFYAGSEEIEMIGRTQEKNRKTLDDIQWLTLTAPDGTIIPLNQIASFERNVTPSEVWRKDKQRVIQVSANRSRLALSTAASKSLAKLEKMETPTGYYYQVGGDYVDMLENEREFRFAFFVMAGLVFIVLASLFESYVQAILVMLTLPMALIGSFFLLWITRTSVTMSVFIGVIMLGGIAIAPAIILLEKMNNSRENGVSLKRAVLDASWVRLSPILNTSLTTIVDLIPMALSRSESAALWAPLALTVIGGATVSTFLAIFMIPALYYHVETYKAKWFLKPASAASAPVAA